MHLESQLAEEVLNAGRLLLTLRRLVLVLLLKKLLNRLTIVFLRSRRLVHCLFEVKVDSISRGHNVVEVNGLHERLDLAPLLHLNRLHRPGHLARMSIDSGDYRMAELLLRGIISVFV